jgi:MFS transporter, DHA1 family, multidrug resistance protein
LCRARLSTQGLAETVRLGAWLSGSAGVWCVALSVVSLSTGWLPGPGWILPGLWLYAMAHGVYQPCSQSGIVASFPAQAGSASALAGFIMSALAFGIAAVLAAWMKHPAWAGTIHPMTLGMGIGGLITAAVALGPVQRHGHPHVANTILVET